MIHEPKHRKISAAPFRDRILHHALCNIIEPLFEARFHPHSYANRVGKGTHRAVDQLQAYGHRYRYALRLDIVQHFPSIDHAILKEILFQVIADPQVQHRAMQQTLDHPSAGNVASVGNPIKLSVTPIEYDRAPPILGQHTDKVLGSVLNLDSKAIAELRESGVIG